MILNLALESIHIHCGKNAASVKQLNCVRRTRQISNINNATKASGREGCRSA